MRQKNETNGSGRLGVSRDPSRVDLDLLSVDFAAPTVLKVLFDFFRVRLCIRS